MSRLMKLLKISSNELHAIKKVLTYKSRRLVLKLFELTIIICHIFIPINNIQNNEYIEFTIKGYKVINIFNS